MSFASPKHPSQQHHHSAVAVTSPPASHAVPTYHRAIGTQQHQQHQQQQQQQMHQQRNTPMKQQKEPQEQKQPHHHYASSTSCALSQTTPLDLHSQLQHRKVPLEYTATTANPNNNSSTFSLPAATYTTSLSRTAVLDRILIQPLNSTNGNGKQQQQANSMSPWHRGPMLGVQPQQQQQQRAVSRGGAEPYNIITGNPHSSSAAAAAEPVPAHQRWESIASNRTRSSAPVIIEQPNGVSRVTYQQQQPHSDTQSSSLSNRVSRSSNSHHPTTDRYQQLLNSLPTQPASHHQQQQQHPNVYINQMLENRMVVGGGGTKAPALSSSMHSLSATTPLTSSLLRPVTGSSTAAVGPSSSYSPPIRPSTSSQQQYQQQHQLLTLPSPSSSHVDSRPSTSGGTDDGASFLEVGVAEDPNPRCRPTMEDAHVVKVGGAWMDDALGRDDDTQQHGIGLNQTQRGLFSATTSLAASGGLHASKRGFASTQQPHQRRNSHFNHTLTPSAAHPPTATAARGSDAKSGYFAIYDGHGGRSAVDYISQHLHRHVAAQLKNGVAPEVALESAFLKTDDQMKHGREYKECGSTVASALLRPSVSRAGQRDLFVANCGDARAVVGIGNGTSIAASASASSSPTPSSPLQALRLSFDHTPHDASEAARVRRAGGIVMRGRVDGQLAVSRAMGDHALKSSGVSAVPHQKCLPLTRDHKFVIVACDGLWDVMSDSEAVNLISGMSDAQKMAQKLVRTAMQRGTTDNVSAMVMRLQK